MKPYHYVCLHRYHVSFQCSKKRAATTYEPNASGTSTKKKKAAGTSQTNRGKNMSQTANKSNNKSSIQTPSVTALNNSAQTFVPISIKEEPKQILMRSATSKDGQLTSEELERHFESRPLHASMLIPEKTPLTVPVELFSNESSTGPPDDDNVTLSLRS